MNRSVALLVCGVLSAPCLSQPEAAQTEAGQTESAAPDARALGATEAILNYCTQADPADADKYQAQQKLLAAGASPEELDTLRNSDEYRQAYDSVAEFTAKVDKHNAKRVCSESVNQRK